MKKIVIPSTALILLTLAGCGSETSQTEEIKYIEKVKEASISDYYSEAEDEQLSAEKETGAEEVGEGHTVTEGSLSTKTVEAAESVEDKNVSEEAGGDKATTGAGPLEEIETVDTDETIVEEPLETEENFEALEYNEAQGASADFQQASETLYTYEDFKGYYLHFTTPDRSHSDMIVTVGENYVTVGWWMSEFELMEITGKHIEGNVLTLDYYQAPNETYQQEEIHGSFQLVLEENEGEKTLLFDTGMAFHAASEQEVYNYEYTLKDFILADM